MQQRRRLTSAPKRPLTAIVSAMAVLASAAVGVSTTNVLRTDGSAIDPVTASVETSSLSDGTSVVVDDAAIAAQGGETGPRTVKEFTREQPFSQFAVTWTGDRDIAAFVRALREDGTWSEWYDTDALNDAGVSGNGVNGTELIYIEPTTKVQVSLSGVSLADSNASETNTAEANAASNQATGAAETPAQDNTAQTPQVVLPVSGATVPLPSNFGDILPVTDVEDTTDANDINVVFIDGGESSLPENGINLTSDSDGMPRIISRAGWGANESLRCKTPSYFDGVSAITIHHTAGSNNYSEAQAPGIVRGIYQYHAQQLGWCDIGYQALADKYGNLYEGRYGGLNKDVWGAHAGGFNENTWAVSMLGNYATAPTTEKMIKAVGDVAGWRAAVAGFDPTGYDTHFSEGTSYSKYAYGQQVRLPNIFAHRDVGTTTCPGDYAYAQMDTIRAYAKAKYDAIKAGSFASVASRNTTQNTTTATPTTTTTTTTVVAPAQQASNTTAAAAEPTTRTTTTTTTTVVTPAQASNTTTAAAEPATRTTTTTTKQQSTQNAQGASTKEPSTAASQALKQYGTKSEQIIPAVGALVASGLQTAANQGLLPSGTVQVGDVQALKNVSLDDLPSTIDKLVASSSSSDIAKKWAQLNKQLGPVLGEARSNVQSYIGANGSAVEFTLFENGIIVNGSTGTNALWGIIGDTWAAQGFDFGPLGLPLNQEYKQNGKLRVDFQGGYITFDPSTGKVNVKLT